MIFRLGPNFVGTPEYLSPETVNNQAVDLSSDLWSLGCILYQLLAGVTPFDGGSPYLTFLKIKAGVFECPTFFSPQVTEVITSLLRLVPSDRMTLPQLKTLPFFDTIDFEQHMTTCRPVPSLRYLCRRYIMQDLVEHDKSTIPSCHALTNVDQNHIKHLCHRLKKLHHYGTSIGEYDWVTMNI